MHRASVDYVATTLRLIAGGDYRADVATAETNRRQAVDTITLDVRQAYTLEFVNKGIGK